jgi:hypothetical protein
MGDKTYNEALQKLHMEILRLQKEGKTDADNDTQDALIVASLFLMRSRED